METEHDYESIWKANPGLLKSVEKVSICFRSNIIIRKKTRI